MKKISLTGFIFFLGFKTLFAQLPNYVPSNQLLAWYPFDNNANDISGNSNDAVNNNVTFIDDRNGNANAAGSFNGTDSWLELTTPSFTFASTGAFTYSFWINKDIQPNAGIVMMVANNVSNNFISLIQGISDMQFGTNKQQSAWIWTNCPHTLNVWDHYVATYDAGVMNLYKNGLFQSTNTFTYTNVLSANLPLYIGKGFGGGYFKGSIDDVGIWDRALNTTEINDLYTNTITSINKNQLNKNIFWISSNIAEETIQINSTNTHQATIAYSILDVKGAILLNGILTASTNNVDIKNFKKGMYFIRFNDEKNSSVKFVKN
jgi:hypothetical protein